MITVDVVLITETRSGELETSLGEYDFEILPFPKDVLKLGTKNTYTVKTRSFKPFYEGGFGNSITLVVKEV